MEAWLRREARTELQIAASWHAEQRVGLGDRFLDDFLTTVRIMENNPQLYAEVGVGVRRALLRYFPYAIFYSLEENDILILSVKHCHGDPENWPTGA